MKEKQMKLRDTYKFVKEKRPIISPNTGFIAQVSDETFNRTCTKLSFDLKSLRTIEKTKLIQYEKSLLGDVSVDSPRELYFM